MRVPKVSLLILLLAVTVSGQEAKPRTYRPGDVLKFEITFTGSDAGKVKLVSVYLQSGASVPANQPGFQNGFGGSQVRQSGPDMFKPEATIPENVATGDYKLSVNYVADPYNGQYGPTDFSSPSIPIENTKTFNPPKIEVKQLP